MSFFLPCPSSFYSDCARILLGVEFQQLEESSPSRLQVKTSLTDAATQLAGVSEALSEALSKPFVILQTVMANSWTHPILLCMMQGSDCESAEGMYNNMWNLIRLTVNMPSVLPVLPMLDLLSASDNDTTQKHCV